MNHKNRCAVKCCLRNNNYRLALTYDRHMDEPLIWLTCDGGMTCPLAVDIGAHRHTMKSDGTLGPIIVRTSEGLARASLALTVDAITHDVFDDVITVNVDSAGPKDN